jgi:hypothetical protein
LCWRSRRLRGHRLPKLESGVDDIQEQDLHIGVGAVERVLEFSDQNILEMKFRELLGERVEENLVEHSQGSAEELCRPRF